MNIDIKAIIEQVENNTAENTPCPGLWSNDMDDMADEIIKDYEEKKQGKYINPF